MFLFPFYCNDNIIIGVFWWPTAIIIRIFPFFESDGFSAVFIFYKPYGIGRMLRTSFIRGSTFSIKQFIPLDESDCLSPKWQSFSPASLLEMAHFLAEIACYGSCWTSLSVHWSEVRLVAVIASPIWRSGSPSILVCSTSPLDSSSPYLRMLLIGSALIWRKPSGSV